MEFPIQMYDPKREYNLHKHKLIMGYSNKLIDSLLYTI